MNLKSHPVLSSTALIVVIALGFSTRWHGNAFAQDSSPTNNLSARQASVAERFQKLQDLLLRLAEMEAAENPERSALLRRAARQSSDQFILERLKTASESLETQEFQKAVENQEAAAKELGLLLTLLMSEDRSERIRAEKDRIQKMVKDLKRTLNNQRSVRARTENGADLDELEKEQKEVTKRGEELKEEMQSDDAPQVGENEESQSGENNQRSESGDNSEGAEGSQASPNENPEANREESGDNDESGDQEESGEKKDPGEETDADESGETPSGESSDPQNAENTDGEKTDDSSGQDKQSEAGNESSPPSESSPSQPSDSPSPPQQSSESPQSTPQQPSPSAPQQPQTPEQQAEQQLQKAIEKMQQAEKALEDAKRNEAAEQQRAAEEDLREAIDELEKILRQLREEEMQRELAKLEARLKKMATMQSKVLDDTVALSATPKSQRNRQTDLKAGELAFEEKKITLEADRAMLLLREEGSSVAFPVVVGQIRSDTARVANLLNETKIDLVSQGIQQDILAALDEMIAALQKAQRDLEKQQQQQDQQPGNSPPPGQSEQPLVEAIAELKLIRTMQVRIQNTTNRYSDLIEEGSSSIQEVLPLLRDLAERQDRLDQITRDLALERNQ